ncbi:toxic anion resistance protein [Candidatus Woesebacteria bacterium]|nr:toxic anion resistance protein [Candidatus Woesebacteria bacterium]
MTQPNAIVLRNPVDNTEIQINKDGIPSAFQTLRQSYPENSKKAMQLAQLADISNDRALMDFGIDVQSQHATIADKILARTTNRDVKKGQVTLETTLTRLNSAWGLVDPGKLIKPSSGLRAWFWKVESAIKEIQQNQRTVEDELNAVVDESKQHVEALGKSLDELLQMQIDSQNLYLELSTMEAAVELLMVRVIKEYQARAAKLQQGDVLEATKLMQYGLAIQTLDQRRYALHMSADDSLRAGGEIMVIYASNSKLYGMMQSKLVAGIPQMKRKLGMLIQLLKSQHVLNFFNEFNQTEQKQGEKLSVALKTNAVAVAHATETAVIDLQKAVAEWENFSDTISEVNRIHEEGRQARVSAMNTVDRLQKNAASLDAGPNIKALTP